MRSKYVAWMSYKSSNNADILERFANSNDLVWLIVDWPHKDARSCCSSLNQTLRRQRRKGIYVSVRKNYVLLFKD